MALYCGISGSKLTFFGISDISSPLCPSKNKSTSYFEQSILSSRPSNARSAPPTSIACEKTKIFFFIDYLTFILNDKFRFALYFISTDKAIPNGIAKTVCTFLGDFLTNADPFAITELET